jgi:uncharacterized protein (TIGR03435 family)
MIPKYLSEMWTAIGPALGNHLWQSTLFSAAAGLLVLTLRKNHARARYWLWLAASLKFLIPFSLLVGIGSDFGWSHASAITTNGFYFAMEQVSQPFSHSTTPAISFISPSTASAPSSLTHLLPALLATAWLCGFVGLIFVWCMRWRRMSAAMRDAEPLLEGREAEALGRLERVVGIPRRIDMKLSRESLEPAVFGIVRPVLLWPEGISDRLDDQHVEAILAHEVWHVRRRDNLSAAMHMVVKAIFWFHPLVWWLGARLAEERECACDEEVLALGSDRQVYAESILKVCEYCVGSPLACVSGVTGADLKKRIVRIMTEGATRKLDFSKKLLLGAAGLAAIAVPVVFGLAHATPNRAQAQTQSASAVTPGYVYEVVSVKPSKPGSIGRYTMNTPDGYKALNIPLIILVDSAYGITDDERLSGAPSWISSEKFDVDAKMERSVADALQKLSKDDRTLARQQMLQALLADRFKLTVHRETKELSIYTLVIAKNGPKLKEAKPGDTYPNGIKGGDGHAMTAGVLMLASPEGVTWTGQAVPMQLLVRQLSQQVGRIVVDKTGLTSNFDFTMQFMPEQFVPPMAPSDAAGGASPLPIADPGAPSLFTAVQEQLGLKLESGKGPVEIIVIDHIERPSGN